MSKSFTDQFNIDKDVFDKTGALDIILDLDTKFFVDPALLRVCTTDEFVDSAKCVEKYFSSIIRLLKHSKKQNDMFWNKAEELLSFKEINGTCIGYSNSGTHGNAIGKTLRVEILRIIKELLSVGEVDPIIFELLGVFQKNMGCDRISDLVTFIIEKDIVRYTNGVLAKIGINSMSIDSECEDNLCDNPYNNSKILLLPKEILSPLPLAESFEDIDMCCRENKRVRDEINEYFDLGTRKFLTKNELYNLVKNNVNFRSTLMESYKNTSIEKYDFDEDIVGEIKWYEQSKEYTKEYPLVLPKLETDEDVYNVVEIICERFKKLIEKNGLWKLLYDNDEENHERYAQLLFYGIADSYCDSNNIDMSREVNNGRGPVDFKFSKGADKKVVVEIKLTSNSQLLHGFERQVPIYMEQEETNKAIYLVIDNGHTNRLNSFLENYKKITNDKIQVITVDGRKKESASRG